MTAMSGQRPLFQLCRNGDGRKVHAKGLCNVCYRIEVWKPNGGVAVDAERKRNAEINRAKRKIEGEYTGSAGRPREAAKCKVCGIYKERPSSECTRCGDAPLPHNATQAEVFEYERAAGWDSPY